MDHNVGRKTVYEGLWINWTDGPIHGSTLTLNTRDGAFLIAFLALYVTLTGTHLWQLMCWITFHFRSTGGHPAAQDDPLQTLLRNSDSSSAAASDFGFAAWRWRRTRSQELRRSVIALHALAVVTMVSFLVAGIFSSKVTNTRSDVLLRSANCGFWTKLKDPGDYGQDIVRVSRWEGQTSVNWADSSLLTQYCSKRAQSGASACMPPGRDFVQTTTSLHDECPFSAIPCTSQTLVLDSGLVGSSEHLGINTPDRDKIAFRKHLTCATINATSFTRKYDQNNVTRLWLDVLSSNMTSSMLWLEPELDNPSRSQLYNGSLFDAIFLGVSDFDELKATFVQNEALWMNYNSGRTKGSGEAYAVQ